MRTALDTNILSSLLTGEPTAASVSNSLDLFKREGTLLISPAVYAELFALPTMTEPLLLQFLATAEVEVEYRMDRNCWTQAGHRYAQYAHRRRASSGSHPKRLLADFIIGAHALIHADRLMTLDITRFKQDFPDLLLYSPSTS